MLVVTYTNYGYRHFVQNFILRIKQLELPWDFHLVCIDEESFKFFSETTSSELFDLKLSKNFHKWTEKDYKLITVSKLDVLSHVLESRPEHPYILYLDTDIWINKDPLPHLENLIQQNPEVDLFIQNDDPDRNKINECSNFCSGFMVLKNNEAIRNMLCYREHFFNVFGHENVTDITGDQWYINHYMAKYGMKVLVLERCLFPNGVFINFIPPEYLILHYNYLVGDVKREKMIKNGHWLLKE
jgi:hypothetical protein